MLFPRISLFIYVGLLVSTTFALPAPYLPADDVATSTLSEDPTPISRSTDLVSRWFDDTNLSRRHPESTVCDISEPGCVAPSKETLIAAADPQPSSPSGIVFGCDTPECNAADSGDDSPPPSGTVVACDTQQCQDDFLGPLGESVIGPGFRRTLDAEA